MANAPLNITINHLGDLLSYTKKTPTLPPQPGDEVLRIKGYYGRITTLLVRIDEHTYRFAGIEYAEDEQSDASGAS